MRGRDVDEELTERGPNGPKRSGGLGHARTVRSMRDTRNAEKSAESARSRAERNAQGERNADARAARTVRTRSADRERLRGADQVRKRSVGATSISASGARAIGLTRLGTERPHGRGETARRVDADRFDSVYARPAVYTRESEHEGIVARLRQRGFGIPRLDISRFSWSALVTPLMVVAVIGIVIAMMSGPVRTYYHAWRDAGRSKAEYEVLLEQNAELNHEVERLSSLEGIEDEARSRGYVYPDEEALVVRGLKDDTISDSERVQGALEEHEKHMPWYVGYLDAIFGYTHDEG